MKKKYIPYIFIAVFILALVAVIIFVQKTGAQCSVDSDCIASKCCHSTQCVPLISAPDCSGTSCTAECVANTLDCGQGACICEKGLCKAKLK